MLRNTSGVAEACSTDGTLLGDAVFTENQMAL
jgi:hypothetical protein